MIVPGAKRWLRGNDGSVEERWVAMEDAAPWCFVTATKVECFLRAAGATREEAWVCLREQAEKQGAGGAGAADSA